MPKIIFSDIDGTLMHRYSNEKHGIKMPTEYNYIGRHVADRIEGIIGLGNTFILATARRKASYDNLSHLIPHKGVILEAGGLILEDGIADKEWLRQLYNSIGPIGERMGQMWDYEKHLIKKGITIEPGERYASIRINLGKMSKEEAYALKKEIDQEAGGLELKTVISWPMLDIIPKASGKENAAKFLTKKYGFNVKDTIGIGNDISDIEMLKYAAMPFCPGNAVDSVKEAVKKKNGHVSECKQHQATTDILMSLLLYCLENKQP